MENSLLVNGNLFDPEHIYDLDEVNALNQYGFIPTHSWQNMDRVPTLEYSSFMPALLPDGQT
jgi:hypothetical protein